MWASERTVRLFEQGLAASTLAAKVMSTCAVAFVLGFVFRWYTAPPVLPYIACRDSPMLTIPASSLLVNPDLPYTCTSYMTAHQLPCVCCVLGHCWRNAHIIENRSRTATVVDNLYGDPEQCYVRVIPERAQVCFDELRTREQNCSIVSGTELALTLRALEMRNGWPPAGDKWRNTTEQDA